MFCYVSPWSLNIPKIKAAQIQIPLNLMVLKKKALDFCLDTSVVQHEEDNNFYFLEQKERLKNVILSK